jgi:hypothetical protein
LASKLNGILRLTAVICRATARQMKNPSDNKVEQFKRSDGRS